MKMKKIVAGLAFAVLLAASVAVAPLSVMSITTYAEETPEHAYTSGSYTSNTESSDTESSSPEASSPESEISNSGETEYKTITYKQVDDATAATESCGYSDEKGSEEDSSTYAQVSDSTTWRIYRLVSLEELKDKTSASVIVKNSENGKAVELTTKVVYKKLNDTTIAPKGYAYVVFVIKNVTNTFDNSGSYFTSDLVWSNITLN